ncbi:MAG: 50S ribosomal protein L6 [Candidatus Latescibacteria bacterium]|nr:50S ribosomal protein L6 [Candidatus Latescibacterota bacterium]
MSRIGKQPIAVPGGVDLQIGATEVQVKGPKGTLQVPIHALAQVNQDGDIVTVSVQDPEDRQHRAIWGLTRALIANAVLGVTEGFEKGLVVVGVGYRADVKGKNLDLTVGFSHSVTVEAPQGIEFSVDNPPSDLEGAQALVKVSGFDKELVGRTAANIRSIRPPEPYKGKGIRYHNEYVRRKAGKTAVA